MASTKDLLKCAQNAVFILCPKILVGFISAHYSNKDKLSYVRHNEYWTIGSVLDLFLLRYIVTSSDIHS